MKEKRINKYYKTCCHSSIEIATTFKNDDGSKNPYYFYDALLQYKTFQDKTIDDINGVESDIKKRLKEENINFNILFTNVLKLYGYVCKYKSIPINENKPTTWIYLTESAVEQNFSLLNFHRSFINELVNDDRVKEAIQVKRFLLENFKGLLNHFENSIRIRLEESPLAEKVLKYEESMSNSINYKELDLLNKEVKQKQPQQIQDSHCYIESYINNEQKPVFPFNELDLIPSYYESKLQKHLKERKKLLGSVFIEKTEIEQFTKNEIQDCKNVINHYLNLFKSRPETFENYIAVKGKKAYKVWLEALSDEKNLQLQPSERAEYEQDTPTFKNNFDNNKPIEIYKHFKTGLVDKGYLTEEELREYLKAAFELQTKPEKLFKLRSTPTKQKIYTVFYVYYKDISQKKHNKQKEYASLLGDFFVGYKTKIIQTNWAREYKVKR